MSNVSDTSKVVNPAWLHIEGSRLFYATVRDSKIEDCTLKNGTKLERVNAVRSDFDNSQINDSNFAGATVERSTGSGGRAVLGGHIYKAAISNDGQRAFVERK
jgi:uncharacterized protein YjbI with pentapeptide repeats